MRKSNFTLFNEKMTLLIVIGLAFLFTQKSDAQNWSALGAGLNNTVIASAVFNGDLYVAGKFTTAGGKAANYIARWNGTNWDSLDTGMDGEVDALIEYKGELYAGGQFINAGGQGMNYIARWDGSSWGDVEGGTDGAVTAFAVYNNELIVGGNFTNTNTIAANYIVKWDGKNWIAMGSGMGGTQAQVFALAVYGNDLIAGGLFTTAGGNSANHVAKWNGTSWSALGSGINNVVSSLTTYSGNLIAGGLFTTAGGNSALNIAKWNGTAWSSLGSGMFGASGGAVLSLNTYNGDLVAGGMFTTAGGNSANYIAKWNGTSWSALGSGMSGTSSIAVVTLINYSGGLVAGGSFTTAGSTSASNIAKWISTSVSVDAGIKSITSPAGNYCQGSTVPVKVQLKNYSNVKLDSVKINWTFNNVLQAVYKWSGSLLADSSTTINIGTINFNTTGVNILKVWTSMPNGINDTVHSNDTSHVVDTVFAAPITNAGNDFDFCFGNTDSIGVKAVTGNKYSWTSNPTGFTSQDAKTKINPLVTTTYILTVTNPQGCSSTDSVLVTVVPAPNALWTSVAKKLSVSFMPADTTLSKYYWEFGDGDTSTQVQPIHNYANDNTYSVSLTVTNKSGCISKYIHSVTVSTIVRSNDAGVSMIVQPNGDICEGTHSVQVQLVNFGTSKLISSNIHWKINGVSQSDFSWSGNLLTSEKITVTLGNYNFSSPGKMTIQSWTSLPNGIKDSAATNDSAMSVVTVFPIPAALTGGSKDICYGSSVIIGASEVSGNTYSWTSKPAGFISKKSSIEVSPLVTTTYYLTEVNSAGCSKTDSTIITVVPLPDAKWSAKDKDDRKFAFTPNNTTYSSYKWYFGDGDSSTHKSPEHTYPADAKYNVRLIVTNSKGCISIFDSSITVGTNGVIENAFDFSNLKIYPNPFNSQFTVSYNLNNTSHIRIYLLDIDGKLIAELTDENKQIGNYIKTITSENLSAGTYILKVFSDQSVLCKKIIKFD